MLTGLLYVQGPLTASRYRYWSIEAMATDLYELGPSTSWTPNDLPHREIILIQDTIETPGSFLLSHFASLFLKGHRHICMVLLAERKEHYIAVFRKLGVASDVFAHICFINGVDALADVVQKISHFVATLSQPGVVLVDDVNVLQMRFGLNPTLAFMQSCRLIVGTEHTLVVLVHSITVSSILSPALLDMASVLFDVTPLSSGVALNVHGKVTVSRMIQDPTQDVSTSQCFHYKLMENGIRCAAVGKRLK